MAGEKDWLSGTGRCYIGRDEEAYPALLRDIPGPPAGLYVNGDPDCLWQPQIAIVGSRNPTAAGLDHARAFSAELARLGFTITSGLAQGIDSAAHEAALEAGGCTVAVMGTGPDRIYPSRNRALARRIVERGALVTELPPGAGPLKSHFPSRNRIISGLSLGVLVIEAGLNSGSLITARLAVEQGREAFALPGSLHNPLSKGCHRLIKQGARLVESTQDILDELGPLAGELAARLTLELAPDEGVTSGSGAGQPALEDPDYARLLEALGHDPAPVDELVRRTGLEARSVSSMLLLLELQGLVEFQPGGRVARRA